MTDVGGITASKITKIQQNDSYSTFIDHEGGGYDAPFAPFGLLLPFVGALRIRCLNLSA